MTEFQPPPTRPRAPTGSRPSPRPTPHPPSVPAPPPPPPGEPRPTDAPVPPGAPAAPPGPVPPVRSSGPIYPAHPPQPTAQAEPLEDSDPARPHRVPEPVLERTQPISRIASRGDRRRAELRADRRVRRRRLRRRALQALAVLFVLAVAATVLVLILRRSDDAPSAKEPKPTPTPTVTGARMAQPDVATSFIAGAASDIAAVTTYDYRTLDDALEAGSAVTVGAYRQAYRAALTGDLATTALQNHVVHTFETLELGVGEMNAAGTQAKVLIFGRERVTDDSTKGNARVTPSTLCATMVREGNRFLISNLVQNANAGLPAGGSELQVAAEAGRSEVINLLSYRRSDFDADVQRAEAGAVSPLKDQIESNAAQTGAAMRKGNYDLNGSVTAVAVERASGDSIAMLVAAQSNRVVDGAAAPSVTSVRYVVTVTRTDSGWAVSQVRNVDGG